MNHAILNVKAMIHYTNAMEEPHDFLISNFIPIY